MTENRDEDLFLVARDLQPHAVRHRTQLSEEQLGAAPVKLLFGGNPNLPPEKIVQTYRLLKYDGSGRISPELAACESQGMEGWLQCHRPASEVRPTAFRDFMTHQLPGFLSQDQGASLGDQG